MRPGKKWTRHRGPWRGEASERDAWPLLLAAARTGARSRHARGAACVSAWVVFGNNAGPPCQRGVVDQVQDRPLFGVLACGCGGLNEQSSTREG